MYIKTWPKTVFNISSSSGRRSLKIGLLELYKKYEKHTETKSKDGYGRPKKKILFSEQNQNDS